MATRSSRSRGGLLLGFLPSTNVNDLWFGDQDISKKAPRDVGVDDSAIDQTIAGADHGRTTGATDVANSDNANVPADEILTDLTEQGWSQGGANDGVAWAFDAPSPTEEESDATMGFEQPAAAPSASATPATEPRRKRKKAAAGEAKDPKQFAYNSPDHKKAREVR